MSIGKNIKMLYNQLNLQEMAQEKILTNFTYTYIEWNAQATEQQCVLRCPFLGNTEVETLKHNAVLYRI